MFASWNVESPLADTMFTLNDGRVRCGFGTLVLVQLALGSPLILGVNVVVKVEHGIGLPTADLFDRALIDARPGRNTAPATSRDTPRTTVASSP